MYATAEINRRAARANRLPGVLAKVIMVNSPFPDVTPQLQAELVQVFKLLSDQNRFRIFMCLARHGEKNVSDICSMVEQSQPAVSHHLGLLRIGRLVTLRPEGKSNYYSIDRSRFSSLIGRVVESTNGRGDEIHFDGFTLRDDSSTDHNADRAES